jgi:hypothetical protein
MKTFTGIVAAALIAHASGEKPSQHFPQDLPISARDRQVGRSEAPTPRWRVAPASGPGHSCTHGCLRSQTCSGSGRCGRSTAGWCVRSASPRDVGVARRLRQAVGRASTRGCIFSGSGGRLEGGQQTAGPLMPRLRREAVLPATRVAERAQLRRPGDSEAMCSGVFAVDLYFFCQFLGPGPTKPRGLNLPPRMHLSSC